MWRWAAIGPATQIKRQNSRKKCWWTTYAFILRARIFQATEGRRIYGRSFGCSTATSAAHGGDGGVSRRKSAARSARVIRRLRGGREAEDAGANSCAHRGSV